MSKPFVYVALDYDDQQKNINLARDLSREVSSDRFGFKINLDAVLNFSPDAFTSRKMIEDIKGALGKPVFVDLKMWNGGRTMENIAKGCADLNVDMINVYAHAGADFLDRVHDACGQTSLFGVTVLTHYTDEDTQHLYGKNLRESVRMLARHAYKHVDGLIVPGTQLDVVRSLNVKKLCPGIRPDWFVDKHANSQEQVVTPAYAAEHGADYIVVGSPILKSPDPAKALRKIIEEAS